jgi:hypothetical protein
MNCDLCSVALKLPNLVVLKNTKKAEVTMYLCDDYHAKIVKYLTKLVIDNKKQPTT